MSWLDESARLRRLASKRLFFIGGVPRSGSTWLQLMLDAHPDIACRGEGHFFHQLALPLERVLIERARFIDGKNASLFVHTGGYPQLNEQDLAHLIGTSILLSMSHYEKRHACKAYGEKTPENVFAFNALRRIFPNSRFISIVRDPRDVLTSAWHLFRPAESIGLLEFVLAALPTLEVGLGAIVEFKEGNPDTCQVVTYESLRSNPQEVLARLFDWLEVRSGMRLLARIVRETDFSLVAEKHPGVPAAFNRKGLVGDWKTILPNAANVAILEKLGRFFPRFDWHE